MIRTFMKYSAILAGLYIVTYQATNAGTLVDKGAKGVVDIEKTLQGR